MNRFMFAVMCALLVVFAGSLYAREGPAGSQKGKGHHHQKAEVTRLHSAFADGSVHFLKGGQRTKSAAAFGDGSVRLSKNHQGAQPGTIGTQSSGAGAGKITRTSGGPDAGTRSK